MPRPQPRPRVLVVDDEESVRSFAEKILRDGGYDVAASPGGPEALQALAYQPPFDLYVIDVVMPQMTGPELARYLREGDPDAKILYFTGYSDRLFADKPTLWADEAFIEKPVTAKALLESVSLLLFGHTRGPEGANAA